MRPRTVGRRVSDGVGGGAHEREPLPTRSSPLPPLPPAFDAALREGLDALGLVLPAPTVAALGAHARLLLAWNAAINLTAIREPAGVARGHLVDSLAALPLLRERGVDRFVDIGTGGGFPGLPLAVALPASRALLVDSIGKKVRFTATAVADLEAAGALAPGAVEARAARAETLAAEPAHRERWPAVLARAVSALPELAELAFPLLRPGGILVAWKREPLGDELAGTRSLLRALGGGRIEVRPGDAGGAVAGLEDHRLVVVEKAGPTPARFPRPPAERRRGP